MFRVDNPHTKPFAFWEWLIARRQAAASRGDLPGRGVHAAEGHAPAGEARLHAVVHLLHLAQHEARAHRIFHGARARPRARLLPPEPVAEHARHPARVPAVSAAGRRSCARLRARCDAWRRATASTARRSSSSSTRRASRAREEYLDSEKYQLRDWDLRARRTASRSSSPALNRIRRDNPALQSDDNLHFRAVDNEQLICYSQAQRRSRERDPRGGQPRSASRAERLSRAAARKIGTGCRPGRFRCTTCCPTRATLARPAQLRVARPAALAGARFPVAPARRDRARFRLLLVRRCERPWTVATSARDACSSRRRPTRKVEAERRSALVQGRRHLSAARQRSFFDHNDDGIGDFPRPHREARLHRAASASTRSGCCRSIPRRCATTATTSPTTAASIPSTARTRTSRPSCSRRIAAACKVITELVVNHTSDQHPWFQAARTAPPGSTEARFLCLERHRRAVSARRASSSPTPRTRTGLGTR